MKGVYTYDLEAQKTPKSWEFSMLKDAHNLILFSMLCHVGKEK